MRIEFEIPAELLQYWWIPAIVGYILVGGFWAKWTYERGEFADDEGRDCVTGITLAAWPLVLYFHLVGFFVKAAFATFLFVFRVKKPSRKPDVYLS